MKNSQNQGLNSTMRYKLAILKRFTNFMFWGPPLVLGSVLFIVWQYQQHPEWLSGTGIGGKTLPASGQLEEPGVYDPIPQTNNPNLSDNQTPFTTPPNANPNEITGENPPLFNPLTPPNGNAEGQANNAEGANTKNKLSNMFPPLFPGQNKQNQPNKPVSPLKTTAPPKIEVGSESELQKVMRQRQSPSAITQTSPPTTEQPSNPQENAPSPPYQSIPNQPNRSVYSPNYQQPSYPSSTTPNYTYKPFPSAYDNQPNNNNPAPYNPYSGNSGNYNNNRPNQPSTINGRPAPYIQPSLGDN